MFLISKNEKQSQNKIPFDWASISHQKSLTHKFQNIFSTKMLQW